MNQSEQADPERINLPKDDDCYFAQYRLALLYPNVVGGFLIAMLGYVPYVPPE